MYNEKIDNGVPFDFGLTSPGYAKYRDIYPPVFYQKILDLGLCRQGQAVLDIGTGTGVLPRNLYAYGACFTGIDLAENQIEEAKRLASEQGMEIDFQCTPAEQLSFPEHSFDVITACQCFPYFDHSVLAPQLHRLLKPKGRLAILYMAWLPFEDTIAGSTEALILKYNPVWTGCGETRRQIGIPDVYKQFFEVNKQELFDLPVSFTRESWNGRILTCRGVGASLPPEKIEQFSDEHMALLEAEAPEHFEILHYNAITVLQAK